MKKIKLALLCDYGLDDAIATAYVLEHYDTVESVDIVPIAGNMPLATVKKNAMRVLTACKPTIPVKLIDTSSIPQQYESVTNIHGEDGLGCVLPEETNQYTWIPFDLWIKDIPEDETIVSLGPATVAELIMRHSKNNRLVIMGGNINEKPNYKGYEFNHGMDIKAFEKLVKHPHIIATLDTCNVPNLDFFNYVADSNRILNILIARYMKMSSQRNEDGCYIYDLIAAIAALHPELFSTKFDTDNDGNQLNVLKYRNSSPIFFDW